MMRNNAPSPKAVALKTVFDNRWSNNEATDEILAIFEGPTIIDSVAIQTTIVYHRTFNCFELIIFDVSNSLWTRFYFPLDNLREKLSHDDFNQIIEEKKDFFRKRHRHFDMELLKSGAKHELFKRVILELVPDLLNFDLSHRLQDAGNHYVKDVLHRPAVFSGYDLKSVTYTSPKPDFLVPANVNPAETSASFGLFVLAQKQFRLCQQGARAFQSVLSKKYKIRQPPVTPGSRQRVTATTPSALSQSGKLRVGHFFSNIRASISMPGRSANPASAAATSAAAIYGLPSAGTDNNTSSGKHGSTDAANATLSSPLPSPTRRRHGSVVQRLGSFFGRRLSVIATGMSNASTASSAASAAASGLSASFSAPPLVVWDVSAVQYRWVVAINKVIVRNLVAKTRQLLKRQVMMQQLKLVLPARRLDKDTSNSSAPRVSFTSEDSKEMILYHTESPTTHGYNNGRPRNRSNSNNSNVSSPAATHRNYSYNNNSSSHSHIDEQQHHSLPNASSGHLHSQPSTTKFKPNPTTNSAGISFRQTLSQVRNKIVAATAFARFEHLRINTKVGADPSSSSSLPASAVSYNKPTHDGSSPHHRYAAHDSNQQQQEKSISGRRILVKPGHNATGGGGTTPHSATISTKGLSSASSVSSTMSSSVVSRPSTYQRQQSQHHKHAIANAPLIAQDSPLMRHASRRVAPVV